VSVIVLNQGESAILQNGVTGVAYDLRLYKNDVKSGRTPAEIDALTEADFTQANFTGYAAAAIATGAWSILAGNPTKATNVEKTFTSSANQTAQSIWGYYVTRTSDAKAIWFEQFPGPVLIEFINDAIKATPAITLDDSEGSGLEIGDIIPTARATAAAGRLLCDGSAVSRSTYAALFAAIGTAYGAGNGSTTFNVPDLRQRFPMGKAASGTGATLGGTGGTVDHVHNLDTATSHAKMGSTASGGTSPQIQRKSVTTFTANIQASGGWNAAAGGGTPSLGVALGGNSGTANPPFQTVNYEIVAQ